MKLVFKTIILIAAISFVYSALSGRFSKASAKAIDDRLYLVLGLDDASQNTDVIFTVSYSDSDNSLKIVHIPRDTYCNFEGNDSKINSLFNKYLSKGLTEKSALLSLTEYIGCSLGVKFSGYFSVNTKAFVNIIDEIGGVSVEIPEGFSLLNDENYNHKLNVGKNLLDGRESLDFVRYRAGYQNGDIERIDTQKMFLKGLFETFTQRVGISDAVSVIDDVRDGVVSNVSLCDLLGIFFKALRKLNNIGVESVTMPGEAIYYNQRVWYYVLNKEASSDVIKHYMGNIVNGFDVDRKFSKNDNKINNIYNKDG